MTLGIVLAASAVLALSLVLTAAMRRFALSHGVLDVPNARSSHSRPMPRGGGISIVVASTCALIALSTWGAIPLHLAIALSGGLLVALIGFIDDRHKVAPPIRLIVHATAAIWALAWLGGLPPLRIGDHMFVFSWPGYVLGTLGIVWTLNLFNFMDGIDGIAGSEAVFVAAAGGTLVVLATGPGPIALVSLMFGAACAGFLFWNWPPAKIFMGDVGSGYVGFFVAVLAIAAAGETSVALLVWLILGGAFFVDATVTFARRLARGERIYEAHRSHAYQWLARRWQSHKRVTLVVLLVNVTWLLPSAVLATFHPRFAGWIALAALVPLAVAAVVSGAGRSERGG
jgi:Fuc2NAc and GlcNAc transferase